MSLMNVYVFNANCETIVYFVGDQNKVCSSDQIYVFNKCTSRSTALSSFGKLVIQYDANILPSC